MSNLESNYNSDHISKLNTIAKLFEEIIYDQLYTVVRPLVIDQQHGFIDGRSTETNLCELTHQLTTTMDRGGKVDVIYSNFSKALDKISHKFLVKKLSAMHGEGDLLHWLESYLRDPSQAVAVKGFCSSFVPVTSGVPQGSHLGPLLFNIFINDVTKYIRNCNILLYADDMKIFEIIDSPQDCVLLQDDLDSIESYCKYNLFKLNIKNAAP